MLSVEKIALWGKYEKEIDEFVDTKKADDEELFANIIACCKQIVSYSKILEECAKDGTYETLNYTANEIENCIKSIQRNINEATRRAN